MVLVLVLFVAVVAVNVLANVQTPDRFESPVGGGGGNGIKS